MKPVERVGNNNIWITPQSLIKVVEQYFGGPIPLDPATEDNNPSGASNFYTEKTNGLDKDWSLFGGVFINPPYSKGSMPKWTLKIKEESDKGTPIIALLPCGARFSTRYFQSNALNSNLNAICFHKGRVKFLLTDGTIGKRNLYDSQVYGYNVDWPRFKAAFENIGRTLHISF